MQPSQIAFSGGCRARAGSPCAGAAIVESDDASAVVDDEDRTMATVHDVAARKAISGSGNFRSSPHSFLIETSRQFGIHCPTFGARPKKWVTSDAPAKRPEDHRTEPCSRSSALLMPGQIRNLRQRTRANRSLTWGSDLFCSSGNVICACPSGAADFSSSYSASHSVLSRAGGAVAIVDLRRRPLLTSRTGSSARRWREAR